MFSEAGWLTAALHGAALTAGAQFKPTTGEWQQTVTEYLFFDCGGRERWDTIQRRGC